MKFLLDTHVWIWAESDPRKFGRNFSQILSKETNKFFASPISTLEISQLHFKKRLNLSVPLSQWIEKSLSNLMLETVQITHQIAVSAYSLKDSFHGDPADRILVATALESDLTLVSADTKILECPWIAAIDPRS